MRDGDPPVTDLLVSSAFKGTIVLALAWIATAACRRASADLRHRIWLAALLAVVLFMIPVPVPEPLRLAISARASAVPDAVASSRWPAIVSTLWILGMAWLLGRFAAGLARLLHIANSARSYGESNILVSDAVTTPMTWGVIGPVILIPAYALDWSADQRDLMIRHEQAHVHRRDWMWQAFAQVMCAIFWFHPLVWLAAARLRLEAELAADDLVLMSGVEATQYAGELVNVARRLHGRMHLEAVAMVRGGSLKSRIAAILDSTRRRVRTGRWEKATIVMVSASLALALHRMPEHPYLHDRGGNDTSPGQVQSRTPLYGRGSQREDSGQGCAVSRGQDRRASGPNPSRSVTRQGPRPERGRIDRQMEFRPRPQRRQASARDRQDRSELQAVVGFSARTL